MLQFHHKSVRQIELDERVKLQSTFALSHHHRPFLNVLIKHNFVTNTINKHLMTFPIRSAPFGTARLLHAFYAKKTICLGTVAQSK